MTDEHKTELSQRTKMILDFAPLIAFFAAYKFRDLYWATGTLVVFTLVSLAITYALTRKIARFPLYTALLATLMGGLTLYLQNDLFIKMKPTVANLIFAAILGGGLFMNRLFLKDLMGSALEMPEEAWRHLTWRWTGFFIFLAGANEVVWRTMSEATWVNFKVFGMIGLTVLFALANAPYMARFMPKEDGKTSADG
jgi:intracellular septation protein